MENTPSLFPDIVREMWRDGRKEEVCSYRESYVKLLVDLLDFARLPVDWP
jgi:hypothetical protein